MATGGGKYREANSDEGMQPVHNAKARSKVESRVYPNESLIVIVKVESRVYTKESLIATVKQRKLTWFGHVTRHDILCQTISLSMAFVGEGGITRTADR